MDLAAIGTALAVIASAVTGIWVGNRRRVAEVEARADAGEARADVAVQRAQAAQDRRIELQDREIAEMRVQISRLQEQVSTLTADLHASDAAVRRLSIASGP